MFAFELKVIRSIAWQGNKSRLLAALLGISGLIAPSNYAAPGKLAATSLKCEQQINPLGIDVASPRLSWILESSRRGETQTAWQVLVATSPERLARNQADLWDSGKIASAESLNVDYRGKPLRSGQRAFWKVRVWDRDNHPGRFSGPAWFEMALLATSDWQAAWITRPRPVPIPEVQAYENHPAPSFRKDFVLTKKIVRARAYVSGLGYYELRLNGQRVDDHQLDPGWTSYSQRVLYSTYDVTGLLQRGSNAVGLLLGNGWFNPLPLRMWKRINLRETLTVGEPRAVLQLVVEYADGTTERIVTDETWRVGDGPVLRNNVYLGEVYDARREQPGWDQPGFDDSRWQPARLADEPKLGRLRAQTAPPIRITRTLKPVGFTEPRPGVFVFDFGQNFAGWARLQVRGKAGTRVRLRFGELIHPDGTLNGMTAVAGQIKDGGPNYHYDGVGRPLTAFQMDEYILKGKGLEVFTPRFTFHGFRYVEVTGFPGRPTLDTLEGQRLNSDVSAGGSFECSNELFNRIQQMVLWTELSNLFSVQSDCPHREKFGYGGDIVASSEMAMLNFDMARFYAKATQDLVEAARPNGGLTETAPFVGISDEGLGEGAGPVGWGTAQPLLLWQLRQYYGEQRLIEEQFEATKRWIALLHTRAVDGILDNGISDHESLAPKPRALTGTAFYYFNLKLFAQLAKSLGRADDAAEAEARAEQTRIAFNHKFLQPGTGRYDAATQAAQAFALYHGLVPLEEQPRALDVLVRDIAAHDSHLTTGLFGTKYLLTVLSDAGRADVAYDIVNQRTFPGWGYMLERGATTLWEHWEFSDNVYSHNHPMFGSVSEWFIKTLAGIQPASTAVGFDQIIIKPEPVGDLKWVKGSYNSVRGKVVSEWERSGDRFQLRVAIPVGATGTVFVPSKNLAGVRESGRHPSESVGVSLLGYQSGRAVFAVGPGRYVFTRE